MEISKIDTKSLAERSISVDDAVSMIQQAEDAIYNMQYGTLLLRFYQGCILASVTKKHGDQTTERIAERVGVHPNTLREARRLAQHFDMDISKFRQWLDSRAQDGLKTYWVHCQQLIRANSDPSVLKPENLVDRFIRRAERLGQDAAMLKEIVREMPEEEAAESIATVRVAFSYTADELKDIVKVTMGDREEAKSDYVSFILSMPCCITSSYPVEAVPICGSEGSSVPLAPSLARELETIGAEKFFTIHNLDRYEVIANYLYYFIYGRFLSIAFPEP